MYKKSRNRSTLTASRDRIKLDRQLELKLLKCYYDQKINSVSPLNFKTMLTKHKVTQVLSLDLKKTPVDFHWNFPIQWSAITNFKILTELDRGESDITGSLV